MLHSPCPNARDRRPKPGTQRQLSEYEHAATPPADLPPEAPPEVLVEAASGTHLVAITSDEFTCVDCDLTGLNDGYLADQPGAQRWHNDS